MKEVLKYPVTFFFFSFFYFLILLEIIILLTSAAYNSTTISCTLKVTKGKRTAHHKSNLTIHSVAAMCIWVLLLFYLLCVASSLSMITGDYASPLKMRLVFAVYHFTCVMMTNM